MANPLYTISTFPADSQAAMREFDERFIASIGAAPPSTWSDLGETVNTSSPHLTFPIGSMAIKYLQTEGESRFKTLANKYFDLKVEEFDTGLDGSLLDITTQSFAYRNWLQGPRRMQIAEQKRRNKAIALLLHGGESAIWGSTANPIDGVNFFSATHLADITDASSATWSNYQSAATAPTLTNIAAEIALMQAAVLDENGDEMGAEPDHILLPTAKYEGVKNLLAQAMILNGETNAMFGRLKPVRMPEAGANSAVDWYLYDSKLADETGLVPWVSARYAVAESLGLRRYDESSDYFKDTGRIKVSSHIFRGDALAFPHAIRKVQGS